MAEVVENESHFRKVKNALVSGTMHISSAAGLKVIQKLFVRTGSSQLATASDVWQYFGPLYREYYCCINM